MGGGDFFMYFDIIKVNFESYSIDESKSKKILNNVYAIMEFTQNNLRVELDA